MQRSIMRCATWLGLLPLALWGCRTTTATQLKDDQDAPAAAAPVVGADGYMTVDSMVARAKGRNYWPDQTHEWRFNEQDVSSPACVDFKSYLFPPPTDDGS